MARKALRRVDANGVDQIGFRCPGCGSDHMLPFKRPADGNGATGPCWGWNGSEESPTITPSILSSCDWGDGDKDVCHSFVTDGRIQFLGDCTHELADQTIDLPELNAEFMDFWGT